MLNSCYLCPNRDKCEQFLPLPQSYRIALVGNPNSGKTSLYNALTGDCQRIGNFPGITVDVKSAPWKLCGQEHTLVDLPGVYSLSAFSRDERVTYDFLTQCRPDLVLNIVDASNLERNLYLTAQLSELNLPVIIVLNMLDVAHNQGVAIHVKTFADQLNVPVVGVVASRGKGIDELMVEVSKALRQTERPRIRPYDMTHEIQIDFNHLEDALLALKTKLPFPSVRWCAIRLTEGDAYLHSFFAESEDPAYRQVATLTDLLLKNLKLHSGETGEVAVMEARYAFASGLAQSCMRRFKKEHRTLTDRIDSWVCHRYLGIWLMLGLVYALFVLVFAVASDWAWITDLHGNWYSPVDAIGAVFTAISTGLTPVISEGWMRSLFHDGVIAGLSGVLSFVPVLFLMFLCISFFEDSGYIARVSFILDRVLRVFGLQGKSILSFVMAGGLGPGCAVPAVMATRTLRNEKDRLVTMLVSPMMICGAKMPILLLLVTAFFPSSAGLMVFAIWGVTWIAALFSAAILSKFLFKGDTTPFVMELPVYHMPRLRGLLMHAWHNTWLYIQKAGTIILGFNIAIWALMYFPHMETVEAHATPRGAMVAPMEYSYAGQVGKALVPIMQYAGMDWRDNIALLGGAAAKEVTYSTLATAYAMSNSEGTDSAFSATLTSSPYWSKARALAFLIFFVLYAPCVATLYAIFKETRSIRWTLFALIYPTALAYLLAVLVYQLGSRFF